MTDQEINEAVARKLGQGWRTAYKDESVLPDYCHSIEAAWEIVEHERRHGYFRLHDELDQNATPTKLVYRCLFGIPKSTQFKEAVADTAPMAICLAFLKLRLK